jgi:bifunctional ADP-heptose synthase (sugar kinase/adenylyltransferase)
MHALEEHGIDCSYVVRETGVVTNTYIKPLRCGISDVVYEDPRLDFENRAPVSAECERKILDALDRAAVGLDVICVSDQMKYGCITPAVRTRLSELGRAGKTVVVDSRDNAAAYTNVILKPNEVEASRAFGDGSALELDALSELAAAIAVKNGRTALLTLGEKGCFVADENGVLRCPACKVEPPIDFCGAGDTFLAGFGTLLAAGATPVQAAQAACLCSAVTIKKLGTTGTATREEVLAAWDAYCG